MCITARLLWITGQENQEREENADAFEIMQVWQVDSAVGKDVRGMRTTAAVEAHDIQQHTARQESSRVLSVKGMAGFETCHHECV